MADETISEKCETLYNKLNSFVASVISRDVTPKISNLNTEVWGSDTQTGNSRIDTLNTNFNNLDSSITTMESDINNVESDVSNLQTSVNSLNTSITNLVQIQSVTFDFGSLTVNSSSTKTKTVKAKPEGMDSAVIPRTQNFCTVQGANLNGTSFSLTAQNQSNGTHTCNATVLLVYFPHSWSI